MTAQEKITKALEAKNWKVSDYDYERPTLGWGGRDGGYFVDIETEDYPDLIGKSEEELPDYIAMLDALNQEIQIARRAGTIDSVVFEVDMITGYRLSDILYAINLMPDRLTIS